MALSRRLGVVAILSSCWFVAVACGDDGSKNVAGEAGAGGEGEGGDGTDSGGSKNTAGKGGSSAGTAGTTNGGAAGSAGTSGSGGNMSEAGNGGVGGEPVAGAGAGGDGGTGPGGGGEGGGAVAGAGGEGGALVVTELKACSYDCQVDADCEIIVPDEPPLTEVKCNQETKKCELPPTCSAKNDCVPDGSFWFFNCEDDTACFEGEVCVTWQGVGWCALKPEQGVCTFLGQPEDLPHHGAQGVVSACVDHTWICGTSGSCEPGCTAELGCGEGNGNTCNPDTGRCECTTGTECDAGVCGPDKKCAECATNDDCTADVGSTGHDVCVDGKCGCSAANTCPDPGFTNATAVCE